MLGSQWYRRILSDFTSAGRRGGGGGHSMHFRSNALIYVNINEMEDTFSLNGILKLENVKFITNY